MNKKLLIGAAGVAILVVGGIAFAASGAGANNGQYDFETAAVDRGDVARVISASGAVEPLTKVDIGSEVSGRVIKLDVDFNSKVKKDQELAQIDPSSFQSAVDQAAAAVLQSDALVATSKATIEHSVVSLDVNEKNWKRQKELYAKGAIAQSDWETADRDYQFAKVQLDSDKVALQSAQAGLDRSKASLTDAKTQLSRTTLRSPIDGVVINRAVDVGQTVQSSMTVATFFTIAQDTSQIEIDTSVVESDIGGIEVGDSATFTVDAFPGERFSGTVSQVRVLGTESANVVTYTVVVRAQNRDGKLLPGMTANAEITTAHAVNALRIANDATRFLPPKALAEAMGISLAPPKPGASPAGQGGAQLASFTPGDNGVGGPGEWLKAAGVDEARTTKVMADLKAQIDQVRASLQASQPKPQQQAGFGAGAGGPPPSIVQQAAAMEMRNKMQVAMDAVMKADLSQNEYDAYNKKRIEAQSEKRVSVFTLDAKGKLARKFITIGIADGNNAQILSGAAEGDKFITRAHPAGEKKKEPSPAAPQGQSPLAPQRPTGRGG